MNMKFVCSCIHFHENAKKQKNENAKESKKKTEDAKKRNKKPRRIISRMKTHILKYEDAKKKKKTKTKTQNLGERRKLSCGEYCNQLLTSDEVTRAS